MNNNYFPFYESFYKAIERLPEEEQLKAYKAIAKYGITGELPEDDGSMAMVVFDMAVPNIDNAVGKSRKGKELADKRWDREKSDKHTHNAESDSCIMQVHDGKKEKEKEKEKEKDIEKERESNARAHGDIKKFVPPTDKELYMYLCEQKISVLDFGITKFLAYYEARGWKGVTDWKPLAKAWHSREPDFRYAGSG